MATTTEGRTSLGGTLETVELLIIQYGLVLIFLWIGLLKSLSFKA